MRKQKKQIPMPSGPPNSHWAARNLTLKIKDGELVGVTATKWTRMQRASHTANVVESVTLSNGKWKWA